MAVERKVTTTTTEGVPVADHTVRDREVIRESHSDRGLGSLIVGALLVLVVAFLGIYMVNAMTGDDGDMIPDEININDNSGGGGFDAPADSGAEAPADSGAEAPADAPADGTGG